MGRPFARAAIVVATAGCFALAGCGGGGGSPTPRGPTPAATPTATAVPTPTAAPTSVPQSGSFAYAGTMTQTIVTTYADPGPVATGTPQATGTQTLAWQSAQTVIEAPIAGTSTTGVQTVDNETQLAPSEQTQTTTNVVYQFPSGPSGDVYELSRKAVGGTPGLASSDTTLATTFGSGNGLVDVVPETPGTSWTNGDAQTQTETDPDGTTTQRTIAANGTYSASTTANALAGGTTTTRAIAENADGSGSYTQSTLAGSTFYAFTYAAPANGTIAISEADGTTFAAPLWFALPVVLYSETDSIPSAASTIPVSCGLGAQFGTTATEVDTHSTRTDTVLGTIETLARTSYDVPGTGVVCVLSTDTYAAYYDYSGANVNSFNFFGTNFQTTVTQQTLALTSATGSGAAHPAARTIAAAFDAAIAKLRSERERSLRFAGTKRGGR